MDRSGTFLGCDLTAALTAKSSSANHCSRPFVLIVEERPAAQEDDRNGVGQALSDLAIGTDLHRARFDSGFRTLLPIAGVALAFIAFAMPEKGSSAGGVPRISPDAPISAIVVSQSLA
jgi:hypothetical protein